MGLFNFGKNKEDDAAKTASDDSGGSSDNSNLEDALSKDKKDMIRGIEDLSQTTVKEVMIPRIDVDFLSIDTPQDELMTKIATSGHSRFPVYSESFDNVVGVLY
ncbi:MAG: magnesium/cobalt efflux protein, partial [Spirochaetaceae bacterium]|nr:magnesium/cobalt efflux protein [Spirochaetaceae bacterium]